MIRPTQLLIGFLLIAVASAQDDPQITEFLAVNSSDLTDGDGAFSDWIEIHNPGASPIDLSGWHLTDSKEDLIRWTFPVGSVIVAGGHELVFASGNPSPPPGEWHAGFSLDGGGEYLALVRPDGVTIVSEFAPEFPRQRTDISYGISAGGALNFFTVPSPRAANGTGVLGFVGDTQFSHRRGFYEAPFDLTISTTETGSTIRYTLDGSEPTPGHGETYSVPISITTTTVLRARAFKAEFLPTDIDTQTFLFVDDVIEQPANIAGWPNNDYSLGRGTGTHDYEMDPEIVDAPAHSGMIRDALKAIPSLSIATDRGGMFGSSGFYDASDVEKPASIEVIYSDMPEGSEQVDGGVEGHSHIRMKRSLRLNFRKELGATSFETDLFRSMPWNPPGADSQDVLILRAGNNRAWSRSWSKEKNTFCEDQLSRQTQLAASGYGMRGAFVHLYINGLYWGLYDVVERADEHFTSRYFGGEADDWFARNHGGDLSGSDSRYDYLTGNLKNKNMANASNYAELGEYLDLEGFVDYLLVHWLTATGDWPNNNWYAGHRMESSPLGATPLRYFAWDSEWSWDLPHSGAPNPSPYDPWVHKDFTADKTKNQGPTMARVFNSAKDSPAFLRLLADRAYRHLFNGGAMSDAAMRARFAAITDTIRDAVVAESARWGDTLGPDGEPTYTRDEHWQDEVDKLDGLMVDRAERMIAALRDEDYYPSIDPPVLSQHGGDVAPTFLLTLTNPNGAGSIRFTLDGSDPSDGGASSYTGPIPITESLLVRTRALRNGEWSALSEATFLVPAPPALRITEIMYHPAPPSAAELAAGFTDQDDFEFIEIHNRGDEPVELGGMRFTIGVSFTFPAHTIAAGGRMLVVSDPAAFAFRYGASATVIDSYAPTRLKNGGESLRLESALGEVIAELSYGDSDPWPDEADGQGNSLVFVDASAGTDPAEAINWRASGLPGGSPGEADILTFTLWANARLDGRPAPDLDALADPEFDGIVNLVEYAFDLDPLRSDPGGIPSAVLEGGSLLVRYARQLYKPDLSISVESVEDLSDTWSGDRVSDTVLSLARETEQREAALGNAGENRQFLRFRITLEEP